MGRKRVRELKPDDVVIIGSVDLGQDIEVRGNLGVRHLANGPGKQPSGDIQDPTAVFWRGDGQWAETGGVSCPLYCGLNSPEGVVTSVVGGIYEQRNAASTTHPLWAKRSGTGNTGWRAWAGMRGSHASSLRMGDNSDATKARSLSFGESSTSVNADQVTLGPGNSLSDGGGDNDGSIVIGRNISADSSAGPGAGFAEFGPSIFIGQDIIADSAIGGAIGEIVIGNLARHYGAGLVIIGAEAGSYAADDLYGGSPVAVNGVIVGWGALASGDCVTVVGHHADVVSDSSVAVGSHASAGLDNTISQCTAVGRQTRARGHKSSAFGHFARALTGHQGSTALGAYAQTNAANQLMIGGPHADDNITNVQFNTVSGAAVQVDLPAGSTIYIGGVLKVS